MDIQELFDASESCLHSMSDVRFSEDRTHRALQSMAYSFAALAVELHALREVAQSINYNLEQIRLSQKKWN